VTLLAENRDLLDAFRRGEEGALIRVYDHYAEEVARFLTVGFRVRSSQGPSRMRLSPLDMEGALQETFVRAFAPSARAAYDGLRPFRNWLFSLARLAAIDTLRAANRIARDAVPLEDEAQDLASSGPSPEDDLLDGELRRLVQGFLAGLPVADGAIARDRFIDGLSQETVAERLGLTRSRLRTREGAIRSAFLRYLSDSGWLAAGSLPAMALATLLFFALR